MKIHTLLLRACALVVLALALPAAHAAEAKKVAGPNGGRIMENSTPRAEFFVTADRKVQITFLDAAGKPVAPAEQTVIVTAGERSAPKTLTFAKSGTSLVSTTALPEGEGFPTVVQIKSTPTAATVVADRFNLEMAKCSECKLSEYACICGH